MRSRYAVVHLDPAASLNMTDDQWVQTVKKLQADGAAQEKQKQEKRSKMLKDIQAEQLKQMQLKKDLQ